MRWLAALCHASNSGCAAVAAGAPHRALVLVRRAAMELAGCCEWEGGCNRPASGEN